MIRRLLLLLFLLPNVALAENFKGYRTTTLDAVIDEWNGKTKSEGPGVSFSHPEKVKFIATLREAPVSCSNASLETVLRMMNFADLVEAGQRYPLRCLHITQRKVGGHLRPGRTGARIEYRRPDRSPRGNLC